MEQCTRCNKEFDTYDRLKRHVGRIHQVHATNFYVEYHLRGDWPKCKCGCGKNVKWSYQTHGFREFCQGHQSRVYNNWGHNKTAIEKSAETRRKQYANGERTPWCKGLTKETNEIVRRIGEKSSDRYTPSIKKEYSERMKTLRKNGRIVPLYGHDHSQWKGGTSSISMLVYNNTKLYKEWKYPILCRDEFKCKECGKTKNLHVHHDKEHMCEIIDKHIGDGGPKSFDEKEFVSNAVVDYHIKNKVSGITLCRECHGKIHPSLNFK